MNNLEDVGDDEMAMYACSDLHGNMELYKKIKWFLDPDDIVCFLGDANDRGKDGWNLIKTIYDDPQFMYLRGNHEDMFIMAAWDLAEKKGTTDNVTLLYQNGGGKTISGWSRDRRPTDWLNKLIELPTSAIYKNSQGKTILLSHAGFTPKIVDGDLALPDEFDLVWGRGHIMDRWDEENFEDYIVVHGHTPTVYIAQDLGVKGTELPAGAYWYCDGHKVCIDNACYHSGFAVLLDLDTLEDYVFALEE